MRSILLTLILVSSPSFADTGYSTRILSKSLPIAITAVGDQSLHIVFPKQPPRIDALIADAPSFSAPLIRTTVEKGEFEINWREAGMVPGRVYYLRLTPGNQGATFRFVGPAWPESQLSYQRLRSSWEQRGRAWLRPFSGVSWNARVQQWELAKDWQEGTTGSQAYYIEEGIRGPINMAVVCQDLPLLGELAQFFVTYLPRFSTLGHLRSQRTMTRDTTLLANQGADAARTLPWIEDQGTLRGARVRECTLCNSQFFHPASRLLGAIARLPPEQRSPSMLEFVRTYQPLILRDHLLRLLYESEWDYWGDKTLPKKLVDVWDVLARPGRHPAKSYQASMQDRDLWLIATAAEMLGANAAAPDLVLIARADVDRLRKAVGSGLQLLHTKTRLHPETKDRGGKTIGSASYFDGDFDDHPDYAYTGYQGDHFPTAADKRARTNTSWDSSHAYRVPVFLRSMWENRSALQSQFPTPRDLRLVVNQWTYRVFAGSSDRPLFHNFFDGSDGWYRVGYHEGGAAYPPSQQCDSRDDAHRPCLTMGEVQGWGLLTFVNSDLDELQHSLMRLALRPDEDARKFRARYYSWNGEPYAAEGDAPYPFLLRVIAADAADRLPGCGR